MTLARCNRGTPAALDPAQARAKNGEPFKFASERRPTVAVRTDEVLESAPPFAIHESALGGIAARKFLGCAYFPSISRRNVVQPRTRGENRTSGTTNQRPRTDFVAQSGGAPVEGLSALPASLFLSSAPQQRCALRSRALARPRPVSETLPMGWEVPTAHLHHISR